MAFANPDPKRVEADKARIRQRHLDDVATIEKEKRVAREIRECYDEHTPMQVAQAHSTARGGEGMIACDAAVEEHNAALEAAKANGEVCWERLGVSNGGKQRKNLYRCKVQANGRMPGESIQAWNARMGLA